MELKQDVCGQIQPHLAQLILALTILMETHVGMIQNANGQELLVQLTLVMQMVMKRHVEERQVALGQIISAL